MDLIQSQGADYLAKMRGFSRIDLGTEMAPEEFITFIQAAALHYADTLDLDPLALSRMAEMHYLEERQGEGGAS